MAGGDSEKIIYAQQCAALSREFSNPFDEVYAHMLIGENRRYLGDARGAVSVLENCVAYAHQHLSEKSAIVALICLAKAVNEVGDPLGALLLGLTWPNPNYVKMHGAEILDVLAAVASACSDIAKSARLWGAKEQYSDVARATSYALHKLRQRIPRQNIHCARSTTCNSALR